MDDKTIVGFRFYIDKPIDYLISEEMEYCNNLYLATRYAKKRLRMYANLYSRDVKKLLIKEDSSCVVCGDNKKLEIDHIVAIANGGKNELSNIQILCGACNNKKRAK